MPTTSGQVSLWNVRIALTAALRANAQITTLLGGANRIYAGKAPPASAGRYIVHSQPGSTRQNLFKKKGARVVVMLDLWDVPNPSTGYEPSSDRELSQLYEQIALSLDGVRLTVTGTRHLTGTTDLVTIVPDPDGGFHGSARYTARVG